MKRNIKNGNHSFLFSKCIKKSIRTWVPNTDTPVIYGIKRLNKMLISL